MGGPAIIDGVEYHEFDNFYQCKFVVDEIEYMSSEQYFQCQKTFDVSTKNFNNEFDKVYKAGAGIGCWAAGSKVKLRKDWDKIKVNIMYDANFHKISQNPDLQEKLTQTKSVIKLEQSTKFWNYWNARILETIRAELRGTEEDVKYLQELNKQFEDYYNGKFNESIYNKPYKF